MTRPTTREAFSILREQREPQVQMAELVDRCIEQRVSAIIEAGTGTGKSFGYLIPAVAAGRRILVATFTLALQDQLMKADLPFLQRRMREVFGITFTAAMLKGASNYLCARRVDELDADLPGMVAAWARTTKTGDMAEIPEGTADGVRDAIKIDLDDCGRSKCPYFAECHYQKAKQRAKAADVLVVNHAILSRGLENPFLLELSGFDAVVIDEAHQFEDVARDAFAARISPASLQRFFSKVESIFVDKSNADEWNAVKEPFRKAWFDVITLPHCPGGTPLRELRHANGTPFDEEKVLIPVDWVRSRGEVAVAALTNITTWLRERLRDEPDHNKVERMLDGLREFFVTLQAGDVIAVAERKIPADARYASVAIETYPLNVGERLQKSLYSIIPAIYTSATVSAGGDFSLVKRNLGLAPEAPTAEIGSPFDYPNQSLLYVPRGINPKDPDYLPAFLDEVERLLQLSQGRAFVLFTSNKAMKDAFYQRRHKFPTRWQEPGASKNGLIEWFKKTPKAVLYATASFWEGVSIEGEALSMVIIDKIPFPPPNDPIYKAKGARLGKDKEFFALSVPSAVIKLKQGFGRLIRTQTDRGMVAILDSRIHGKGYGRKILASLPPATLITELDGELERELVASYLPPPSAEGYQPGQTDDPADTPAAIAAAKAEAGRGHLSMFAAAEAPVSVKCGTCGWDRGAGPCRDCREEPAQAEALAPVYAHGTPVTAEDPAVAALLLEENPPPMPVGLVVVQDDAHLAQLLDAAADGPAALAALGITFAPADPALEAALVAWEATL